MKLTRYPVYDCHHADADSTTLSNPIGYATTRGGAIRILRRQYGGELEPRGAELLDVERHGATVWDGLMNWDDLANAVKTATGLDDLLDAIETLQSAAETAEAKTDDQYGRHLLDELMPSLPTFGGCEPANTVGIWSWDTERLLIGEGELAIIDRSERE